MQNAIHHMLQPMCGTENRNYATYNHQELIQKIEIENVHQLELKTYLLHFGKFPSCEKTAFNVNCKKLLPKFNCLSLTKQHSK